MDEHIGLLNEFACNLDAFGRLQIDGHPALIPISRGIVIAQGVMKEWRPRTAIVANFCSLDLDDICAIVPQQHAAEGPRHCHTDFYNFNSCKRCRHLYPTYNSFL